MFTTQSIFMFDQFKFISVHSGLNIFTIQPGKVQISSDVKALLPPDRYYVESRGLVWVKVRIATSLI